jgi:hypothetical protein
LCGKDCKFRANGRAFEPGVSGSGTDESADSAELEAERRAEEKIESWNSLGRKRQAQDETKRKTAIEQNPKEDPNQVRVTLTTRRNAQGRVTGTSSSHSLLVPAQLNMNPPDLTALTTGDEEYILVKVSRKKRACWVTNLNGGDPDNEHEFHIGTTMSGLMDPSRAITADRPQPPRLARVQMGEMVDRTED